MHDVTPGHELLDVGPPPPKTPLERALEGEVAGPGPLDAFTIARRQFLASERIEISAIAAELGVSRVTLHRWVGSRAALMGTVLASLAEQTITRGYERSAARGGLRLAGVASQLVEALLAHDGMRALLGAESEFALRALTTRETGAQRQIVDAWIALIEREVASGYQPPIPPSDLAFVVVRLCESFVYRQALTGELAEAGDAAVLFQLVLAPTAPLSGP